MTIKEVICAWCKRIKCTFEESPEKGYASHGICEDCRQRLLEQA